MSTAQSRVGIREGLREGSMYIEAAGRLFQAVGRASVEAGDRNRKWGPSRKGEDRAWTPRATRGHRKGPSSNRILKLTSLREAWKA